ncbi:hypothetical protein TNCV_4759121 [Trichonephila clavipes]|nr:hypothetical protein TNCV_4759121 [Trichonephila clavipes]
MREKNKENKRDGKKKEKHHLWSEMHIMIRERPNKLWAGVYRHIVVICVRNFEGHFCWKTSTAGSVVVQSGRPIFDDFFQHLWPYIGNNTANVVFQMVKRLWLIRIDQ